MPLPKRSFCQKPTIGRGGFFLIIIDILVFLCYNYIFLNKYIVIETLEKASKIANLHEFVSNELPKQYQTTIGERGVRLSGGQRQRIGIARALYYNPEVLIFDEATSALDSVTERLVMEAVHKLGQKKTIIMSAHRLSTVRECDCIFVLENGKIEGQGTFNELVKSNTRFKNMSKIDK